MSQPEFDRALERMATGPAFASTVRANPVAALEGYDLTDTERAHLGGMQAATATATPPAAALATRRSKSSMLGIGAVAGVAAVGAGGFGLIHYVVRPSSGTPQFMSLDHGAEGSVNSLTQGANKGSSLSFSIAKPFDHLGLEIGQDATTGKRVGTVTVRFLSGGQDVKHVVLNNVIFTSVQVSQKTGSDGRQTEVVKLLAESEQTTYP